MPSSDPGLSPSVLDRLIDPNSAGSARRRGYDEAQMASAILRDLEDLFNTRQSYLVEKIPAAFDEVRKSLLTYGLPDLVSFNILTPQQRSDIERSLEQAVARFEPRLSDVKASLLEPKDAKDRKVQIRVQARVNVDPAPELPFDTILELSTDRFSVPPSAP